MSQDLTLQPMALISIPGVGPINVLPGAPGVGVDIIERGPGAVYQDAATNAATFFENFKVGILGIGGLMGFALFLFLFGKGLSALGI